VPLEIYRVSCQNPFNEDENRFNSILCVSLCLYIRRRQLDKPELLGIFIPVNLHKYRKHCLFICTLADVYWWFL